MKPKTPLPWESLPCYFDNQCTAFKPADADYMLHACNTYPRHLELLGRAADAIDRYTILFEGHPELIDQLRKAAQGQ